MLEHACLSMCLGQCTGIDAWACMLSRDRATERDVTRRNRCGDKGEMRSVRKRVTRSHARKRAEMPSKPVHSQAISGSPGDRLAWSTHRRDALSGYLDRTCAATGQLSVRFVELSLAVGQSQRGFDATSGGISSSPAFSSPPLRLDVVAEVAEIERLATDLDLTARRVLSLPGNARSLGLSATVKRLRWLAGVIPSVWNSEPSTGHTAAQRIWASHARAGRMLGLVSAAFQIENPCPACHQSSLWVDPDSWSVACGLARCGYSELIESRPIAWVSGTRSG